MIRKSQREFDFNKHVDAACRLAQLNRDFHQLLSTLRGSRKVVDLGIKAHFWMGRLRGALDAQLLRDFPEKYSGRIYFPDANPVPLQAETTISSSER